MKRLRKWLALVIVWTLGLFCVSQKDRKDLTRAINDVMNKQEWILKCSNRLQDKSKIDSDLAKETAEACLENLDGDLSECPINAADEEMSCWACDDGHDDAM